MIHVRELIWDDWNVAHMARHAVTRLEVEEVCQGEHVVLEGYGGRLVFVGPTAAGRMIAAVLDPLEEEGLFYPITARPAARKERRIYQEAKQGE